MKIMDAWSSANLKYTTDHGNNYTIAELNIA